MSKELETYQKIERSIITKFRRQLWTPFVTAVKRYELVQAGDKIAVCISGGKDSMLMAKLMQELHRHSDVSFSLVFLVMDPGYNELNRQKIESNAALLHIPITVFETNVFEVANNADKSPCYLCAKMRRGYLYSKAGEMGCNKIALGHHMSDVIETTVMGMFYGSQLQAMPPKLHSKNFAGMELIRPMYCILEEDILSWKRYNDLEFIQCACRFTENCTMCDNGGGGSKRQEIKILLRHLKKENPNIEKSIFNSIHSVCLDTMVGYKTNGFKHSFLEHYYDEEEEFKVEIVSTKKAPAAIGPYSQAIIVGNMVYTSGQIPIDPETGTLKGTDITAQTEQAIKNLIAVLDAAGSSLEKTIKTTCFLKNMQDFAAFNSVYERYFTGKPARSCVEVSALPKGALVEIEVIALG